MIRIGIRNQTVRFSIPMTSNENAACRYRTYRRIWAARCKMERQRRLRNLMRTRRTSFPAWPSHNGGIWSPSSRLNGPVFRNLYRTVRNETRRSTWPKIRLSAKKLKSHVPPRFNVEECEIPSYFKTMLDDPIGCVCITRNEIETDFFSDACSCRIWTLRMR